MRRHSPIALALIVMVAALTVLAAPALGQSNKYTIALVFKAAGDDWYLRIEEGVRQFAEDTGHNAFATAPETIDVALQIQLIEDLIARGVDALAVIPTSVEALEPVLKRAMDQGIVVITHEGPYMTNNHLNIEAFDNEWYGAVLMDTLAELTGGEGEYLAMVGGFTLAPQMTWIDSAEARQAEKYPNLRRVRDRLETGAGSANQAYAYLREALLTYPNLNAVITTQAPDMPGIGRAIEEMGLEDEVFAIGTSIPSIAGEYVKAGSVKAIGFWDPGATAYAMNKLAVMVLEGQEVSDGMDLEIPYPGYDNIIVKDGKELFASAAIMATAENVDDYPF